MQAVYLLHFDKPISPDHTAQHYLGYADNLDRRIRQHRRGKGARFTQVAKERGIGFAVAQVWPGQGRRFERQLKRRKCAPRFCPVCADLALQAVNPEIEF